MPLKKLFILVIMGHYFKKQIHLKNILSFGQKIQDATVHGLHLLYQNLPKITQNMLYYSYFR